MLCWAERSVQSAGLFVLEGTTMMQWTEQWWCTTVFNFWCPSINSRCHISTRSSLYEISRIAFLKFLCRRTSTHYFFWSVAGNNMFVPNWHSFILCIRVRMRSGGEEVEGDEDSEDSKDKEDGEGEDDEWQHVCSDLTLFHAAQRVEDQIALAGHLLIIQNYYH